VCTSHACDTPLISPGLRQAFALPGGEDANHARLVVRGTERLACALGKIGVQA